jgi:tetratricopeptide (TPR) repeat protein
MRFPALDLDLLRLPSAARPMLTPAMRASAAALAAAVVGVILAAAFAASTLAVAPSTAAAQGRGGNPLIRQGQQQYDDLEFEQALQTLSAALVRAGNTPEDNATIYRLLAFTYLALGREEEAAGAYRGLLALQPDFEPSRDVSPQQRQFFARVKAQWEADGRPGFQERPPAPVSIRHRSPPQATRGTEVPLEAEVEDPDQRVARMVVAYHQGSSEAAREVFNRLDMVRSGQTFRAALPASAVAPPLVEYYLEALDRNGLPIASRGDVAAPLRIAVPAPGGGILSSPWFWIVTGIAVVGTGVAIGVAVASSGGGAQPGTFVLEID